MKNCLRRLSTLRVRHMPFRISRRSALVSDASMAARRRNPSHASTSSARACSSRLTAEVPGVVSAMPSGAATCAYNTLAERAAERRAGRIELDGIARLDGADAGLVEHLERHAQRKRIALGDEGAKAARQARQAGDIDRA